MSNTLRNQMVEWNTIPWRKLERRVFKLQKRIFQASQRGDTKAVRKLHSYLDGVLVSQNYSCTQS